MQSSAPNSPMENNPLYVSRAKTHATDTMQSAMLVARTWPNSLRMGTSHAVSVMFRVAFRIQVSK